MSESYLKEITLPSKGLFYEGKLPNGTCTIEPMGTSEEKLFSSGSISGSAIIEKVFDSCLHLPNLNHGLLVLGDRLYALLQIRAISYGDDYSYPFRCSECRAKGWGSISIPAIPIRHAKPDAKSVFSVTLPILDIEIGLRLLRGVDEDKINQYVEQVSRTGSSAENIEYVYRLARRIESIQGKEAGIREAMELVEKLKGKDSLALRDAIDDNDVGPELLVEPVCKNCGYPNGPLTMPFDKEFFRPRRGRTGYTDYIRTAEALDIAS